MLFGHPAGGTPSNSSPKSSLLVMFRLMLRNARRPVIIVALLAVALFTTNIMQDQIFGLIQQRPRPARSKAAIQTPTFDIENLILTVTKTQTNIIKTTATRTVFLPDATDSKGHPTNRQRDAFGFPIYSPDEEVLERELAILDPPQSSHHYRQDGLLEVNPDGPHPIFELIEKAEQAWKEKHDKASRTLKEACVEYERRYGRKPPKGFDKWWAFVKKNNAQLPDEYDQIHWNLEPFWGINPMHLRWIQEEWEAYGESYTVGKLADDSPLEMLNYTDATKGVRDAYAYGANLVMDVLKDVEKDLPPFRAVFSPHDNPSLLSDWHLRREATEAAKRGEYIDLSYPREAKLHGWKSACSPLSHAWIEPLPKSGANGVSTPPTIQQLAKVKYSSPHSNYTQGEYPKTFIHDHKASLDICDHPAYFWMHGQFLAYGAQGPVPQHATLSRRDEQDRPVYFGLAPYFGYSPTRLHDDIVTAMPMNWVDDLHPRGDDPPFDEKTDYRLHWRGSNTGIWCGNDKDLLNTEDLLNRAAGAGGQGLSDDRPALGPDRAWWLSQRGRLIDWANRMWEGQFEVDSGVSNAPVIGVPHEIWRRSDVIRDASDSQNWQNDTLRPAMSHSGVLRSTATKDHRLAVPGSEDSVGIKHKSQPIATSDWAPAMCDIAFAGQPMNCDGTMCKKVATMYEFRKGQNTKEQGRYKFIIDVDGNGWSSRFKRLITSNSLIFKATAYPEWFSDRIQPWLHYVPIQLDFSDLLDALYFFRGDPSHHNNHLHMASKIASDGRDWSKKYWRRADMTAYMYRLFLEYSRVMGDENGVRASYDYREEDEVSS